MDNYDKLFTTIENYQNMTVAYLAVSPVSFDSTVLSCSLNEFRFAHYSTPRSARVSFATGTPEKT